MTTQQYVAHIQISYLQNMLSLFIYVRSQRYPVSYWDIQRGFPEAPEEMLRSTLDLHPMLTTATHANGNKIYAISHEYIQSIER